MEKVNMDDRPTFMDLRQTTRGECFLIVTLTFLNIVNYMDRVGIAAVLVNIGYDLKVGDDYGGLLQTVLLVAYTILAPMFGYLGDRCERKFLLVACICLWAVSTVGGAHCGSYWWLLLSRILVGVGQSGFTTISPTVISDIAVGGARSVFLACFYIGIPIGAGLGYVIVIFITNITGYWTWALCVGPVLCFIGATMLIVCHFPVRGEKEPANEPTTLTEWSCKKDLLYLSQVPSFLTLTAAFANVAFLTGALSWWMPTCLYYGFQIIPEDPTSATLALGMLTIVTGIVAVLLGLILSRCLRPRFPSSDPIICGTGQLIAFPMIILALCMTSYSRVWTFVFIFVGEVNLNLNWAILVDMLLYIIVPNRRTSAQGVNMFVGHGLGDCISPYIIGFLSEYFQEKYVFANNSLFPVTTEGTPNSPSNVQHFHAIQLSLMIASFTSLIAGAFYFLTGRFITKDIKRAQSGSLN